MLGRNVELPKHDRDVNISAFWLDIEKVESRTGLIGPYYLREAPRMFNVTITNHTSTFKDRTELIGPYCLREAPRFFNVTIANHTSTFEDRSVRTQEQT